MPYPNGLYFRASIVEQMPDPLSPLFADLIDGSVSRSLRALMSDAVGKDVIREDDVGLPTINGYAYYYYRNSGMWRVMGKSLAAIRALARGKAHMGVAGWREFSHPRYEEVIKDWSAKPVGELSGEELLEGVQTLLDAGTVYYTAVQSIIPIAATSEISFRAYYDKFVRRDGDPPALTFLLGYDSEPIRAEKSLYDLAAWAREVPGLAQAILTEPTAALAESQRTGLAACRDGPGPLAAVASPLPGTPRPVRPCGLQPGLRQPGAGRRSLAAVGDGEVLPAGTRQSTRTSASGCRPPAGRMKRAERSRGSGRSRRAAFLRLLRWAQRAAPIREDALADVGLAWPLLRRMLFELGRRLVDSAVIAEPADVFWLRHRELRSAVEFGLAGPGTQAAVAITGADRPVRAGAVEERKMLWRGQAKAAAPQLLPESRWMERAFGSMMPAGSPDQPGDVIKGAGASSGQVSAPARVLRGPEDFARMVPGRRPGGPHHHAGLDLAVRDGLRRRYRRRRPVEPQLDRGPRVRHPGRARHRRRHPAAHQRPADPRRRRRRHRHDRAAGRSAGSVKRGNHGRLCRVSGPQRRQQYGVVVDTRSRP